MRLDKFLAQSQIGTRKIVRQYVKDGLVKINGITIFDPAVEINEIEDIIEYNGQITEYKEKVYYMFNKPSGCITARKDADDKTVFDYFKEINMDGVFHVGRLDKDTEGLLLFTNDGDFNNKLMSPKFHVDKKYFFIALGSIDEKNKKNLESGVSIGENEPITKPAKIENLKNGTYEELKDKLNLKKYYHVNSEYYIQPVVCGHITISEGRRHQVKRMLKSIGCHVIYLKRMSIGNLALDEFLKKGDYRSLTKDEIKILY